MKFAIAFTACLLLASSCSALFSKGHIDFDLLLRHQHIAMRSLVSTYDTPNDIELVNLCFNGYLKDQAAVVDSYNKEYNGCVDVAQRQKDKLTEESSEQRNDLLSRSNDVCQALTVCDVYTDGLEFFECYNGASSDTYKVLFTLNSDANTQYTIISAAYLAIESDLSVCFDQARLSYAKDMDVANENLQTCLAGGSSDTTEETTTEEPTTEEPTTEEPTTEEPTTEEPTTEEPTTEEPTTEEPTTEQPTTEQPTTEEPTTEQPTTEEPTTEEPTTEEPTTEEPTTEEPTTEEPTTEEPTTEEPTTEEPTTEEPTTEEPTTEEPTTPEETAPEETTPEEIIPEETTEKSQEEDVFKALPLLQKHNWQLFKRHF
ncbi:protein TsetseEP [Scaptodrosophila lebanonensis]|uniref:Protein TsetseEP n=1 Tax=Drosophila lebanonensis TaxID=7225 RepID=A0A6J2U9A6_DROLE|nr:protein TsetseEP [Scaptodrosophila lebanonensis]